MTRKGRSLRCTRACLQRDPRPAALAELSLAQAKEFSEEVFTQTVPFRFQAHENGTVEEITIESATAVLGRDIEYPQVSTQNSGF